MAQKTAWNAAALTESDIVTYLMGEGGAHTSWTPTCTQSGSVTVTNTRSRYARYGRLIVATFDLTATTAGTSANAVTLSLPVTAAATASGFGTGYILDQGAAYYVGTWTLTSTTAMVLYCHNETGAAGVDPAFALANTDIIRGTITYEAAS